MGSSKVINGLVVAALVGFSLLGAALPTRAQGPDQFNPDVIMEQEIEATGGRVTGVTPSVLPVTGLDDQALRDQLEASGLAVNPVAPEAVVDVDALNASVSGADVESVGLSPSELALEIVLDTATTDASLSVVAPYGLAVDGETLNGSVVGTAPIEDVAPRVSVASGLELLVDPDTMNGTLVEPATVAPSASAIGAIESTDDAYRYAVGLDTIDPLSLGKEVATSTEGNITQSAEDAYRYAVGLNTIDPLSLGSDSAVSAVDNSNVALEVTSPAYALGIVDSMAINTGVDSIDTQELSAVSAASAVSPSDVASSERLEIASPAYALGFVDPMTIDAQADSIDAHELSAASAISLDNGSESVTGVPGIGYSRTMLGMGDSEDVH